VKIRVRWKGHKMKIIVYSLCLLLLIVASVQEIVFIYQGF
jgi:hypothetical protein